VIVSDSTDMAVVCEHAVESRVVNVEIELGGRECVYKQVKYPELTSHQLLIKNKNQYSILQ
jgi:hypothetical protein